MKSQCQRALKLSFRPRDHVIQNCTRRIRPSSGPLKFSRGIAWLFVRLSILLARGENTLNRATSAQHATRAYQYCNIALNVSST